MLSSQYNKQGWPLSLPEAELSPLSLLFPTLFLMNIILMSSVIDGFPETLQASHGTCLDVACTCLANTLPRREAPEWDERQLGDTA